MKAAICVLVALCLVQIALCATGNSYCNAGSCEVHLDCDLGLCCNGTCVREPTYLNEGENCSTSDACRVCDTGLSCIGDICTPTPPQMCPNSKGCECEGVSECSTFFCSTNGTCESGNLDAGDSCFSSAQCKSGECLNGFCVGIEANATCPAFSTGACGYGLLCNTDNFIDWSCVPLPRLGEECTTGCADWDARCVNGTCINKFSSPLGGPCNVHDDCEQTLSSDVVCRNHVCQVFEGNCDRTQDSCNTFSTCVCNGTEGTTCVPTKNQCIPQYTAFATCMRTHECQTEQASLWNTDSCAYLHCSSELLEYTCCQNCRGVGEEQALPPGVDCAVTPKTYTVPMYCNTTDCPALPSRCTIPTTTGISTTGEAATTGELTTTGGSGNETSTTGEETSSTTGIGTSTTTGEESASNGWLVVPMTALICILSIALYL